MLCRRLYLLFCRRNHCLFWSIFIVSLVFVSSLLYVFPYSRGRWTESKKSAPTKRHVSSQYLQTTRQMPTLETSISSIEGNKSTYAVALDSQDRRLIELNSSSTVAPSQKPSILFWNPIQFPTYPIPEIPLCGGGCQLTELRDNFDKSDAIVFTMKEFNSKDLPRSELRRSDHVFVFWTEESPWASRNMYHNPLQHIENDYFNWTMTYKRESDVNAMMIPYNARDFVLHRLRAHESRQHLPTHVQRPTEDDLTAQKPKTKREVFTLKRQATKLMRRKVKIAAWVSSNCGYTAGAVLRRKIVTRLQFLGLSVEIYGKCGTGKLPDKLAGFVEILSEYRFYLAFENSLHCREYVTEKFWYNSLYAGVVPVIWGPLKSDVSAVAPPHSFIHYEDFASEKDLVKHLLSLTKNETEYMRYFAWWWNSPGSYPVFGVTETAEEIRDRQAMFDFEMNAICHLCNLLNKGLHKTTKKTVHSMQDWWYQGETSTCLSKTHKANKKKQFAPLQLKNFVFDAFKSSGGCEKKIRRRHSFYLCLHDLTITLSVMICWHAAWSGY